MSASPVRTLDPSAFRTAAELICDGLRQMADGFHLLGLVDLPSGPRLVRQDEELLDVAAARKALGGVGTNTLLRLAKRNPTMVRHVGRRTFYERGALLRATRRG